mgnify:CR=1 FL=1|tara:strand:+ start:7826 stop:9169 length:1344 start_codon:yes stop_codon:yes gene_type:complete
MSEVLNRVIWAEGVFLGQQHFQQWDAYHESAQMIRSRTYAPLGWGITEMKLDMESLRNGLFRVESVTGIFPNGRLFHYDMQQQDNLVYDLTQNSHDSVELYLCMPMNGQVNGVAGYTDNQGSPTWLANYANVQDKYDSSRVREVMIGQANLFLLRGDEAHSQYSAIKISEVERLSVDHYALSEKFIPTVTHIKASRVLHNVLRRMIELAEAKARVLAERRDQFSGDVTDFGHSDLAHFLLLESLSSAMPELKHLQLHDELHPERLYSTLVRIAGQLSAFNKDAKASDLPAYQHNNLSTTFTELEKQLLALMDTVMPAKMQALKLVREADSLYIIDSIDSSLLDTHTFFIAVYMDKVDDTSWIDRFSQHVKVGSRGEIEGIVASAMPGVHTSHMQRTPNKLPVKSGYEYFRIDAYGKFWDQIVSDRSLGIFIADEFEQAKIDIVTVQE